MEDRNKASDPRAAFFDSLADEWDTHPPDGAEQAAGLKSRAELLGLAPGMDVLEVGCGTGKLTAPLAAMVAPGRVTALDFAPAMISRAEAKGIDADFRVLDVCAEKLDPETFDRVLCFHSFPHFRDPQAALVNLSAALKPEGRLVVMHLAGSSHINEFHAGMEGPVAGDLLPVGEEAWDALLSRAGLEREVLLDGEDGFFLRARPEGNA